MSGKDEWVQGQAVNEKEQRDRGKDRGGEKEYRRRWSRRGEGRQMNSWEKKKKGEGKRQKEQMMARGREVNQIVREEREGAKSCSLACSW